MIKKRLIRCVQCSALTLFSSMDRSPEYDNDQGEWKVLERDDEAAFIQRHQGHRLEELHVIKDSLISHQRYLEPLRTSYFEASNGKERFVVKRFRKSVSDPQSYELVPGKLHLTPTQLRIDGRNIQKELESVFSPLHLFAEKIHYYVRQLEETVSHVDPNELKRVPFESHNPSVRHFYLNGGVVDEVSARASKFFNRTDVKRLDQFVRQNLKDDLFMAVAKIEFRVDRTVKKEQPKNIAS